MGILLILFGDAIAVIISFYQGWPWLLALETLLYVCSCQASVIKFLVFHQVKALVAVPRILSTVFLKGKKLLICHQLQFEFTLNV